MSLAVPYLLDAAASTRPDARVRVGEREITCVELDATTRERAESLLSSGLSPGDRLSVTGTGFGLTLDALAAARVGLVLTDGPAPEPHGAVDVAPLSGRADRREVAESAVWSETLLAESGGWSITHGAVVDRARSGTDAEHPLVGPLVDVLRAIDRAVSDRGDGDRR